MKTALQIVKNRDIEERKAKEQAGDEKAKNKRIRALQTPQKTTPQEKSWVEDGSGKDSEKVELRREKGALHKRK